MIEHAKMYDCLENYCKLILLLKGLKLIVDREYVQSGDDNQKVLVICIVKNIDTNYSLYNALNKIGYKKFIHRQYNYPHMDGELMDACFIMMGTLQYISYIPYHCLPIDRFYTEYIDDYLSVSNLEEIRSEVYQSIKSNESSREYIDATDIRREVIVSLNESRYRLGTVGSAATSGVHIVKSRNQRTKNYSYVIKTNRLISEVMDKLIELNRSCRDHHNLKELLD